MFYVYNVDAAAARMTSCRAHRKLYAQDILVDRMPVDRMPVDLRELQIKFAGFGVIITDAIRWMKNIIPGPALRGSRSWSRPHHQGAHHLGNAAHNAARHNRQNVLTSTLHQSGGACMEREKNQPIDELSIRDQRLQQVDTIMAELQDKIIQSKRNTTLLNAQQNEAQSAL